MTAVSSRQSEAVMMVVQNNDTHSVRVSGANQTLLTLLGYDSLPEEAPLNDFLGAKTRALVEEDVEFDDDAKDVMQVLSRLRDIKLRTATGSEIAVQCKISRSMAHDRHHLFRLVFFSTDYVNERQVLINSIKYHFMENHTLDEATQLPDRSSLSHYIALTQQFSAEHHLSACFVYMQLSPDSALPESEQEAALHHVGQVIVRNLREDDTIGRIAADALGIVLIDVNKTTVHLALNRIRHMIVSDPYQTADGQTYIPPIRQAAIMLEESDPQEVVDMCVALLQEDTDAEMVLFKGAHPSNPFDAS